MGMRVKGFLVQTWTFQHEMGTISAMSQVGSIPSESSLEDYVCSGLVPLRYK